MRGWNAVASAGSAGGGSCLTECGEARRVRLDRMRKSHAKLSGSVAVGRSGSRLRRSRPPDEHNASGARSFPHPIRRQPPDLEEALGVKLLNRGYRSISFTAEGERFFRIADSALQQLHDGVNALAGGRDRQPVTITASIGVTGLWIMPRLGGFQQRHPDIDVRVAANNKVVDLRIGGADVAIRYCPASNAPPGSQRLFGEAVAPVAHPSLGVSRLDPESVARHVLIEYDDSNRPWLQWADRLHSMGLSAVKPKGVLRYNQYDQAIRAALEGQGIALGRIALIEPLLSQGRLVAVGGAGADQAHGYAYWLVQADATPPRS
jgi:LysR family transcriptional regulator, glycine cleavage system transcriptional activator